MLVVFFLLLCGIPSGAQTWKELTPSSESAPPPRMRAAGIFDPVERRLVVIGGRTSGRDLNDVWVFDPGTSIWEDITPTDGASPAPRSTHDAVYDPANHRILVWSGRQNSLFFNDVWAFALESGVWQAFATVDPMPNIRYGTTSVFDPQAEHLVTFAGFTEAGRFEDTWRFAPGNAAWTEVVPADGNPGPRCLHAAAYDPRAHRMIIYGGQRGSSALGDVWALDLHRDVWTELTPAASPPGRFFAAPAYDSRNHRLLIFGGNRGADDKTAEVWAFDLEQNTWERLIAAGEGPEPRDGSVAVYVASADRLIVFGGAAPVGLFDDVWALEGLTPDIPTVTLDVEYRPAVFSLHPNFPNPFNTSTTIRYELPRSAPVELTIYDLLGRKMRTLVDRMQDAGTHAVVWDGKDGRNRFVGSGAYLYRLKAGGLVKTRKLLLLR